MNKYSSFAKAGDNSLLLPLTRQQQGEIQKKRLEYIKYMCDTHRWIFDGEDDNRFMYFSDGAFRSSVPRNFRVKRVGEEYPPEMNILPFETYQTLVNKIKRTS